MDNQIIFVKTRHIYESYLDFWHLVELSEFPTIYVNELDISQEGVYIVCPMNGEWRPHINNQHRDGKPVNAHLILWNLERPSGSAGSVGQYAKQCRYLQDGLWPNGEKIDEDYGESYGRFIDEVWVSDARLADETITRFVILGSDYGLGEPGRDKEYDLSHMSYETGRRQSIYKHLDNKGANCWPPERDEVLKKSRFALNVHQDHNPFQEPLRFALFAAYGLPILSENCFNAYPWTHDETMIFATYDGLVSKFNQMLEDNYGKWRDMGERARKMMCEQYQFGDMVRQAVRESVGVWR
jgi:hypothetical protein